MKRKIDLENKELINKWVRKSIDIFLESPYFDRIFEIYNLELTIPPKIDETSKRKITMSHQSKNTEELFNNLLKMDKFPYDDPVWYAIKNLKNCYENNPEQVVRIVKNLYKMTAEEIVIRIESPPALNQQIGPMFNKWLRKYFSRLNINEFVNSSSGIYILDASEQEAKDFVNDTLHQNLEKRPDLVSKVNETYILGEAKWVGQPGGNQTKQIKEVIDFCKSQREDVRRLGIVDGFPWAVYYKNGKMINSQEAVLVQESEYDIISALLLNNYLESFL